MQCAENRLANPGGSHSQRRQPPPTTVRRRFAPRPEDTTGPHSPRQPPDHTGGNATASAAIHRTVRRAAQQADVWTTPRPIDRPATSGVLVAGQSPLLRLLPTTQPDHTAPGSPPITQGGSHSQRRHQPHGAPLRNKLTCGPRQGQLTALQQVECLLRDSLLSFAFSPLHNRTTQPQAAPRSHRVDPTASAATNRTVRRCATS
jgi:hypothetical protein